MPLPQVNERIKEVPAQALRAVFAGIGQVLLVADKIRNRAVEQVSGPATATTTTTATAPPREAPPTEPAAPPSTAPAEPESGPDSARWRSLDETGNVRLISEGDEAAEPAASAPPTPDTTAPASNAPPVDLPQPPVDQAPADHLPEVTETPATPTAAETPAAPQAPAAPEAAVRSEAPAAPEATDAGALPLSNYDELTIASLRARLRVLSPAQVSTLLEYEKATEGRPAVITMFERRLAKLEQEGS